MKTFKYFFWTSLIYACFFGWQGYRNFYINTVILESDSSRYFHDSLIKIKLFTRNSGLLSQWKTNHPKVEVLFDGKPVSNGIGGLERPFMRFDDKAGVWAGLWPCPWNASAGQYSLKLADFEGAGRFLKEGGFAISYRKSAVMPKGFSVLTYESDPPSANFRVRGPDGAVKNWEALADWAEYAGADAFWMMAGKTTGAGGKVWNDYDKNIVRSIGKECHKRGIKFGVWAMCYLTHPQTVPLSRYEYGMDIKDNAVVATRGVSLRDPKRPEDIIELLSEYADMPEVDFIGLDYIRNALGGYELAEDFYRDMPWITKPAGWDRLSADGKIIAFANLKIPRKDKQLIDAWQWWRAHKTAGIVRHIRSKLNGSKALWVFTLGWEKGWQHGQDPVMMADAGADIDAVMLYEATKEQFSQMMIDFSSYLKNGDTKIITGDIVDAPLHQGEGSGEFKIRMRKAMYGIYKDGMADGIFVHDLARALWGRRGEESTLGWMNAAREIIREFKRASQKK